MPHETEFAFTSDTVSWWKGFVYLPDPLRVHMSTFYHLSYLIGKAVGIQGSFMPYQIVYGGLWWARGFVVFLIGVDAHPQLRLDPSLQADLCGYQKSPPVGR